MKQFFLIFALVFLATLPAYAQLETKPTPLWEGVEKSAEDVANDDELVRKALEIAKGDREVAVRGLVDVGWQNIGSGNPNGAIRAFNQASLIEPKHRDIFWGFAIATHIRGDELAIVERWIAETGVIVGRDPRLITDHGRILGEREMPQKAKEKFEEALNLNPGYVPAHMGMIRVAQELGDKPLEDRHRKIHNQLTGTSE